MAKLGINIDHVATLRQARRGIEPDPVEAALICEKAGCDSIVAHLREDRRHINDDDTARLKKAVRSRFNLEMSINKGIVKAALEIMPHQATLVPEKREEITTEGGLDILSNKDKISKTVEALSSAGIEVSLFIDPEEEQVRGAKETGAKIIEIHTGRYANAKNPVEIQRELTAIESAQRTAEGLGITVNAGHGLDYDNVKGIAAIKGIEELNIGHSIISRAVSSGLENAVKEMLTLIK